MEIVLEVLTSVEEKQNIGRYLVAFFTPSFFFFPFFYATQSLGCVFSTHGIKIHEISSWAFCLALARLG